MQATQLHQDNNSSKLRSSVASMSVASTSSACHLPSWASMSKIASAKQLEMMIQRMEWKKFSIPLQQHGQIWQSSLSLWPYALHYAMCSYNAASVLQGIFLGFQAGTCMQDQDTTICSRSILHTYLFAKSNTSMQYFQNMRLVLNLTQFCFMCTGTSSCATQSTWYCPTTTGN